MRTIAAWLAKTGASCRLLAAIAMACLFSMPAHAAFTVTSNTLTVASPAQGPTASTVYVKPSGTISATVTVTISSPTTTNWRSLGYRFDTTSAFTCNNHAQHDGNPPAGTPNVGSETFNITAPAAAGTYNVYFRASSNDSCGGTTTAVFTGNQIVVDGTAPTAVITCATCANPTNASSVSWTVTFPEIVTGVAANNFALTGTGTSGAGTPSVSGSGTTYTVTATTGADGTLGLNLNANLANIKDQSGNVMTAAVTAIAGNTYTVDKTVPTITAATIASSATPNTQASPVSPNNIVTLSITTAGTASSSPPVVTIAGRAATAVTGGPTSWSATQTMVSGDAEGTIPFTINVSDLAGNAAVQRTTTTNASSVTFDKTPATATIVCAVACTNPTNAASVSWTVTFNQAVTGVAANNFALSGAGATGAGTPSVSPVSSTVYTVTATTGADGALGLNMNANLANIKDNVGNPTTASTTAIGTNTYTIDKTAPVIATATIVSSNTANTALAGPLTPKNTVTLTFTTTGTAASPLPVVTIGGSSASVSGGPTSWTATRNMSASDTEGVVAFTINVSDTVGNAATQRTTITSGSNVTFDKTPPAAATIVCAVTCTNATNASSVSWTVTFGEPVTGVTAINFALSGTGLSGAGTPSVSPVSSTVYTVTATTGVDGTLGLNLNNQLLNITDQAGNQMTAPTIDAPAFRYTIDKAAPTIPTASIVSSNVSNTALAGPNSPKNTVTLSFTTTGTAASPLPVVTIAGRAAAVSGGPTSWSAVQTMVLGDANGTIPFTINVSDVAGNAATQRTATTNGSSVVFDSVGPTATITCSSPSSCGPSNPTSSATVVWAVNFSEAVTGLTTADFGFSGATSGVTIVSVQGSNSNYTVTANTGAQGELGLNLTPTVNVKDAAGNVPSSVVADASNKYTINSAPSATITCFSPANCGTGNPTSLGAVTWAVTFNESVSGVTLGNFTLTSTSSGAALSGVSGSGTTWYVTVATGGNGTVGVNLSTGLTSIVDSAGTSPPAVFTTAATTYTIDSTASGECFIDNFTRASLGSDWSTSTSGGTYGLPRIVSNRLQLTDNSLSSATAAHLQRVFPAAGNKVVVEFDYYSYNGNGADGMAVILSDGNIAPVAGAFGGSLGYAQKGLPGVNGSDCANATGCPGFAGGWIGVGLDEFGNFSNASEGRIGGAGVQADTVVVRGSGSGLSGYNYHTRSSALSPGIDLGGATPNPGHRYRITVDHTDGEHAYVKVDRDTTVGHTSYVNVIPQYDAKAKSGQAAVPTNWYLSYTASTGSQYNTHEVANLKVCTTRAISVPTLHHVRMVHDGGGVTCAQETVTLKACADASCSSLYLGSVTADIATTNGSWTADPVTFTGGQTTVKLTNATITTSVLSGVVTSPTATSSAVVCYNVNTAGDCNLPFTLASCAFDAVEVSKNPSTPIYTKLAGTSFNIDVLALSGGAVNQSSTVPLQPELVDQNSAKDANGCGTTVLAGANPASYTLVPGNLGRKTFAFTYPNAANDVRVKITSGATTACSSDNFAIRPASFTIAPSNANNPSGNLASPVKANHLPVFVAGLTPFNLTVAPYNLNTVTLSTAPLTGYTGTAAYSNSAIIPHEFAKRPGEISGNFAAAISTASPGVPAWNSSGAAFTYSEVGNFKFAAYGVYDNTFTAVDKGKTPSECFSDAYMGTTHELANPNINTVNENGQIACFFGIPETIYYGRFIPDHFDTVIVPAIQNPSAVPVNRVPMTCPSELTCPSTLSGAIYANQPFKTLVVAKRYGATSSADDGVTMNYEGTTWARDVTLGAWSTLGGTALANPPSAPATLSTVTIAKADFDDGVATLPALSYGYGTRAYSYLAPTTTTNWISPTDIYIRASEKEAKNNFNTGVDTVSDGITSVRTDPATSVEAGLKVLSGRMYVPHVFGSELLRLRVPVLAQYWNGTRWVTSYVDNTSAFALADVVKTYFNKPNAPSNQSTNAGNTSLLSPVASTALVAGAGQFTMQAAGAGVTGAVDFRLTSPVWLPSTVGRSRVGTYRSPLIYIREVY